MKVEDLKDISGRFKQISLTFYKYFTTNRNKFCTKIPKY